MVIQSELQVQMENTYKTYIKKTRSEDLPIFNLHIKPPLHGKKEKFNNRYYHLKCNHLNC